MLAVAASGLVATPATSAAAPGTWGAGRYPYADGKVCRGGTGTSPLAAWTVSGGHRAYLTRAVTSDGRLDSAAPPIPSAGTPAPAFDVAVGAEFGTEQDIAAVAYLLSAGGDAVTLATAVLALTDGSELPACADTAAAFARLAAARQAAGPYQVTVSAPAGKVRPGIAVDVTATVKTAAGVPVRGTRVAFTGPGARFASPSAVTDANGVARDAVTVSRGSAATITVTAIAAVSTGLKEATIQAAPSATNPTGVAVPAVYAAPPVDYSGQAAIAVDQTAHPVVSTALSTRLVRVGAPFTPRARISGLNGHSADVTFDLLGPLPLTDRTLCADVAAKEWTSGNVHAATTSSITVNGDGTAPGGALTPTTAGCYALRTSLSTVDAAPAVTKTAPLAVVAALDTAVTRADTQPAVFAGAAGGAGKLTGVVRVTDTHGLTGTVSITLTGPIRPADGDCGPDAKGWTRAARHVLRAAVRSTDSTTTRVTQAGGYDYSVPAPETVGCYRARPAVALSGPGGDTLTVAATDDRPAYVLAPTLSASVEQTWAVSPATVPVQVQVDGLFGLPAHVRAAMYVAAADPAGCAVASFAGATRAASGPAAEVPGRPGAITVSVESGATPKVGCYSVVPELTLDADPRVRVAGTIGASGATLIAGVDPDRTVRARAQSGGSGTSLAFLVSMGVLAGLILAVIARVGYVAWRDRNDPVEEQWSVLGDGDPLDLGGGELPSGT